MGSFCEDSNGVSNVTCLSNLYKIYLSLPFLCLFSHFDIQFGALLSCFSANSNPTMNVRLVQKLGPLISATGEHSMNEFDCPRLKLTYDFCFVSVCCLIKAVSIIYIVSLLRMYSK